MALVLLATLTLATAATNSTSTAIMNSTNVPTFILFNTTTATVNAMVGSVLFTKSPRGYNMSMLIMPGTYANVSNVIYSNYNVTLSTFRVINVPPPANASNDIPRSAFLFQINHQVIQATVFVNRSGAPHPVTFLVNHKMNWTSWSYINETVNGTGYTGGMYSKQNKWIYNTSTNTMADVTLEKAQMHIYELMPGPASDYVTATSTSTVATTIPTTTVAATIATTTIKTSTWTSSGSSLWAIIIVVLAIVLIAAVVMMRKKPKDKLHDAGPIQQQDAEPPQQQDIGPIQVQK